MTDVKENPDERAQPNLRLMNYVDEIEKLQNEIERLRQHIKKLERRIHNQRVNLRMNWEIGALSKINPYFLEGFKIYGTYTGTEHLQRMQVIR